MSSLHVGVLLLALTEVAVPASGIERDVMAWLSVGDEAQRVRCTIM